MQDTEKANIRAMLEGEQAREETHIHQRLDSIHLIAEMFGCSTDDVEIMLSLLRIHGVYAICEAVEDMAVAPVKWTFGTVVTAAKIVTLKELYGKIDGDLHDRLTTVTVSTQKSIYGTALTGGEGLNEKTLMAFSDMIKYGVNLERMSAMGKAYIGKGA